MGQPEGVSDCVVRTTEASIGKQGPSSESERQRTGKGEQERNTARVRKMGNGARAIRQADEHRVRREGEKGKGRGDSSWPRSIIGKGPEKGLTWEMRGRASL